MMRTGIDCKGKPWEEIPLGGAADLAGQTFNHLTALFRVKPRSSGTWWLFQCECGNQIVCRNNAVTGGGTISCGCYKYKVNLKDITRQRYGKLVVLERGFDENGVPKWKCQCDCGKITYVSTGGLDRGTSSCGCINGFQNRINAADYDLTGQSIGYLTVLERVPCPDNTRKAYYKCLCDCGKETIAKGTDLRNGRRGSCGCKHRMSLGELAIKKVLDENQIDYLYDTPYFKDLIMSGGGRGRYDFILINKEKQPYRLIEFDGRQHTDEISIWYLKSHSSWFQNVEQNDKIKNDYAREKGLPLVRIPYNKIKDINYNMLMSDEYLVGEQQ